MKEIEKIRERIQVIHSDPAAYFGQRETTSKVEISPVDQAWMGFMLTWFQTWAFTPAQADHLMMIIRAQTIHESVAAAAE